jgi:hypothetical protein
MYSPGAHRAPQCRPNRSTKAATASGPVASEKNRSASIVLSVALAPTPGVWRFWSTACEVNRPIPAAGLGGSPSTVRGPRRLAPRWGAENRTAVSMTAAAIPTGTATGCGRPASDKPWRRRPRPPAVRVRHRPSRSRATEAGSSGQRCPEPRTGPDRRDHGHRDRVRARPAPGQGCSAPVAKPRGRSGRRRGI